MNDFSKWWKSLGMGVKIVIIVVAVIVVYYIFTYIKGYSTAIQQNSQEQAYVNQGQTPSFSDDEYNSMADELVVTMAGAGTYFEDLKAIMAKLNNNLDAVKLNQAFGQRSYTSWYGGKSTAGLKSWLDDDLSSSEISEMYQLMKVNGVTYKFI